MGDPKKNRKKYSTPAHPWQAVRLKEESEFVNRFKSRAKSLIAADNEQSEKERKQLISRLVKLNLVSENATLDDVLGLKLDCICERRLQTFVYKLNLTRNIKQA